MVKRPIPEGLVHESIHAPRDPNTLSNYNAWRTTHITANLEIDFARKRLFGDVVLRIRSLTEGGSEEVILDASYLDVKDIRIDREKVKWDMPKRFEPYGNPLSVKVEKVAKDKEIEVAITLSTTDECTALQWLTPAQTSNKKHPYMFSQCQAIHARSIFPCQDTPDVKASVDFNIRSPLPVVCSGLPTGTQEFRAGKNGSSGTLLYTFKQEVPIPSYLFAVASGDLATASIGPRSNIVTGPEELVGCKWELEEDMERFMEAGEKIVYPYAWGMYNVLVLPASFPYGGMENPIFTFATPTIISKDRQNVDVIAHELSHSWSGNLVSNASWEHFWLNEGWTTYLERRIQAEIHGEPFRDFSAIIGWKALQDSIERYGEDHEFTQLVIDLKGKDPDDAFSSVPYEKGFVFLYHLEKLIGKDKWDKFIPHYFTEFKFKSLDSYDFKACLLKFFESDKDASAKLEELDWDTWFYKPGYPPKPDFDDSMVKVCYELADSWKNKSTTDFKPSESDISSWLANQSVVFLEKLQTFEKSLPVDDIELMGKVYGFDKSANVELVSRYYGIGLKGECKSIYKPTAELLGTVGRMKFVRPLYRLLNEVDRELAVKTFEKNKEFYHPICRGMVEKDLFGKEEKK
ncbi:putative leukotriene A-4 hydrolase like protein [Tothia fuscella]|uniref:Leukotriene A(4) hydrolase n=1 Tax=Tothia fuscella TaxID=1048955 RepID=A0A9P4NWH1_9PEZI|nr:putative leukotriene A-4 hydrolase like protein [Tothia fuscella]